MGVRDEARSPWSLVIGALAGVLGWAVGLPVGVAAGIGAAVFVTKVAAGAILSRPGGRSSEPRVSSQSEEGRWLERANRAVTSFRRLGQSAAPGPVTDRLTVMGDQAAGTLDGVRRLAVQASAVGRALGRIDREPLVAQSRGLAEQARVETNPDVLAELERSRQSVQSQLEVRDRLEEAAAKLRARMESGVLGLEGLVARLVEVLAMVQTQSPVEGAQRVDALADELEGLRAGLAEAESISRGVLSAYRGQGSLETTDRRSEGRGRLRWTSRKRGGPDAEAS